MGTGDFRKRDDGAYSRSSDLPSSQSGACCYTGTWLPYGYEAVDGKVVVIEAQAAVVRRIFEWRAEERSLRRMANELNATGVPTQHGRNWHPGDVRELDQNRFYTGKSKAAGGWIDGQHKAVVSKELFRKANAHNRKAG